MLTQPPTFQQPAGLKKHKFDDRLLTTHSTTVLVGRLFVNLDGIRDVAGSKAHGNRVSYVTEIYVVRQKPMYGRR
jgi:hypothetical protein